MGTTVIGLTGGLASGKTLVARILAELGALLLDTDQVSREVVASDSTVTAALRSRWPQAFTPTGILDRGRLARIIFADPAERKALNAVLHPPIIARVEAFLARPRATPAVVVIPLLVEANLFYLVDETWVVWCRLDQQLDRLMRRDSLTEEEARRRLGAQLPLDEKLKHARVVIRNDETQEETRHQVEGAWRRVT